MEKILIKTYKIAFIFIYIQENLSARQEISESDKAELYTLKSSIYPYSSPLFSQLDFPR